MEESAIIQVGSVEETAFEIIDLIHQFSLSADFAHWITEGKFVLKILREYLENGKYTRIFQYELNGAVFFTGTKEFYTETMERDAVGILLKKRAPLYSGDQPFSKINRINISKIISEPYYNMISNLYNKGTLIGVSWEIYDLSRLTSIYDHRNDPIRYWRKERRE